MKLERGWIGRQLLKSQEDYENWPPWMKNAFQERKQETMTTDDLQAEAIKRWNDEVQKLDKDFLNQKNNSFNYGTGRCKVCGSCPCCGRGGW